MKNYIAGINKLSYLDKRSLFVYRENSEEIYDIANHLRSFLNTYEQNALATGFRCIPYWDNGLCFQFVFALNENYLKEDDFMILEIGLNAHYGNKFKQIKLNSDEMNDDNRLSSRILGMENKKSYQYTLINGLVSEVYDFYENVVMFPTSFFSRESLLKQIKADIVRVLEFSDV